MLGLLIGKFGRHKLTAIIVIFIIIFTIIYCALDWYSNETNFNGIDEADKNSILPKLYFSTVTQSTVGYGDISPKTTPARWVSMIQIMSTIVIALYLASYIDTKSVQVLDESFDQSLRQLKDGKDITDDDPEDRL
jgi:uncharacterized protein YpmB